MQNSFEDIKSLKNYALGVAGFGTTIAAVLIEVFHLEADVTIACVIGFALLILLIGFFINRSERRQNEQLQAHRVQSQKQMTEVQEALNYLKKIAIQNQRSCIRNEMNDEMRDHPENHDTILEFAHRYFVELKGDWVQTDKFLNWVDSENAAGRKVHVPADLFKAVSERQAEEEERHFT